MQKSTASGRERLCLFVIFIFDFFSVDFDCSNDCGSCFCGGVDDCLHVSYFDAEEQDTLAGKFQGRIVFVVFRVGRFPSLFIGSIGVFNDNEVVFVTADFVVFIDYHDIP